MRITCKTNDTLTLDALTEEWRDVKDYEGLYQVSSLGRIKALPREKCSASGVWYLTKEKILCNSQTYVCLVKDDVRQKFYKHQLVAKNFIPNPDKLPFVFHKDLDVKNNCVSNLIWCTRKFYMNHFRYKVYPEKYKELARKFVIARRCIGWEKSKEFHYKPILRIDLGTGEKKWYESIISATKDGFSRSSIGRCLNGRFKQYKGYKWEYMKNN